MLGHIFNGRALLGVISLITFADRSHGRETSTLRGFDSIVGVGEEEFGNPNPPVDTGGTAGFRGFFPVETATADSDAHLIGHWSPVVSWPICPIHAILLKDGRILTYGSNPEAHGSAGFHYDVWDPKLGMGDDSHQTLNVTTDTNIFCSGQINLPDSGEVLILGGTQEKDDSTNFGTHDTQLFNPGDLSLRLSSPAMAYSRWYPSLTTLGSGDVLVQAGRDDNKKPTLTPELFNTHSNTWQQLDSATSYKVYGRGGYWYPMSYLASDGSVVVIPPRRKDKRTKIWNFNPLDTIEPLQRVGKLDGKLVTKESPSVMYDTNKVLIFHDAHDVSIMDIQNPMQPQVESTGRLSRRRNWANTVALPNGEVLLVGGTSEDNAEANATRYVEIWNPQSGLWRIGASAAKSRLYHSTALLLPDARVLVGGGGPPGAVVNQNAEIYSPPYLYKKDGSGELAPRPVILSSKDDTWNVTYSHKLMIELSHSSTPISRVSFIRLGSVTHSFNMEERMQELSFQQNDNQLVIQFPTSPFMAPPGYYMLFVVDEDGVPSESIITKLCPSDVILPLIESLFRMNTGSMDADTLGFSMHLNSYGQLMVQQEVAQGEYNVLWQTTESGNSGEYSMRLQRDCNLVITEGIPPDQGSALWTSRSSKPNNDMGCFMAVLPEEQRIVIYRGDMESTTEEVWTKPLSSSVM